MAPRITQHKFYGRAGITCCLGFLHMSHLCWLSALHGLLEREGDHSRTTAGPCGHVDSNE